MRNYHAALLPFLLIGAVLLSRALPASAGTVDRQDAMGREVALNLPLRRIVSLAPSVTEILFAIGADDLVVGVSKHCDFPLAAKLKPKAGNFNSPDMGKVKAAAPDVVLFAEYARGEDLQALEGAGIPAFVLTAASVADIILTVRRLGDLSGRPGAAEGLAAAMEGELESLRRKLGALPVDRRPRVYVEVDGPKRLYAVGPGSFMDDVITIAGGRNVFADRGEAYFAIDSEEVVRADPEVVLIDYPFQYKVGASKRPAWERISAVRNGRVYDGTDFDIILLNRPGPRILQSLREIAVLLHPGIFGEE
jgi:iron complex transport system substrate-binding protein